MSDNIDIMQEIQSLALQTGEIKDISTWPKPEKNQTLSECAFMRENLSNLGNLNEMGQKFFASIYSKLDDEKISQEEYFSLYTQSAENFSIEEMKTNYFYGARLMNPVTCSTIDENFTEYCNDCPHFCVNNTQSPITIRSENHTPSKDFGYWRTKDTEGKVRYTKDVHQEDLMVKYQSIYGSIAHEESGQVYNWNGKFYQPALESRVGEFVTTELGPNPETGVKRVHRVEFMDFLRITNIKPNAFFMSERLHYKINCNNGIVDIPNGEILPHNSTYPFRYLLPYDYDPEAKCPNFMSFLRDVCVNDKELINIIQEYLGYCIAGGPILKHKSLFLDGDGSNGKSTFVEILKLVIGSENYCSLSLSDLKDPNNRFMMTEKLVNIGEENDKKSLMNSSQFKVMAAGGDTTAKKLWVDTFTFKNKTKFILLCNGMPITDDRSGGLKRRLLIIPFKAEFSEKKGNIDVNILDKMRGELSGILNFSIKGFQRLEQNKYEFSNSEQAEIQLEEYELENNTAYAFMKEHLDITNDSEDYERKDTVYAKYQMYCKDIGKHSTSDAEFWKQIRKHVKDFTVRKINLEGGRKRVILGILLI